MKNMLLCLALITCASVSAQSPAQNRPRLVVGIVIDQMRPDYIDRFWNKFGQGGFRRIWKEGYNCRNAHYNFAPTYTGPGHASIYTGTTPSYHGIVGNDWFDAMENDTVYCTLDTSVTGIGSTGREGKMSPHRLLSTTVADQLRLHTGMKSKTVGIALKDRGAILPVGRSANAAYWFDGTTGNWISSSWYMTELPKWARQFNERRWPEEYLSKPWKTLFPIDYYTESDADNMPWEAPFKGESKPVFPHDLPALRGSGYDLVRRTPFGNTLTKDFALAAVAGEDLGGDSITDFLTVSFSSPDYIGHQFGPRSIEIEDNYIRLDRDLADLLRYLDIQVGKGRYLLFLTADHACAENPRRMKEYKLEAGFYDSKKVEDSLKSFLIKEYGHSAYLKCYLNEQVYLDETRILSDKRTVCEIEDALAAFLLRTYREVHETPGSCQMKQGDFDQLFRNRLQNGTMKGRSGNLWVSYAPGWTDRLYGDGTQGCTHGSPYPYDAHVPLVWMGWRIPQGNSSNPLEITDIAPTLSLLLQIPFTNACTGRAIPEITP